MDYYLMPAAPYVKFCYFGNKQFHMERSRRKSSSTNLLNEVYLNDRCVLNQLFQIIGSRWSAEILLLIQHRTNRFSDLKASLTGISDNILSDRLNRLIKAGFLEKEIFNEVPLHVEYHLTESGNELMVHLHELCDWAKQRLLS